MKWSRKKVDEMKKRDQRRQMNANMEQRADRGKKPEFHPLKEIQKAGALSTFLGLLGADKKPFLICIKSSIGE